MPVVDMNLEELKKYQGRNPCPRDFDSYWETAVLEMRKADPQISLEKAEFQVRGAECFHLYFTSTKGARIHAKYIRPENKTNCPAVLLFHGYTGNSGDWSDKLSLVSQGFAVAALDCRGQAGLSQDMGQVAGNTHHGHIIRGLEDTDPRRLLFRDIFLDTAKLAEIVMRFPEIDEARVCAMGGSQGGALTIACAALEPRIRMAVPTYPFLCDYKRVWEMDLAVDAYAELKTYFRAFDPRHEREDAIFEKLGYIDLQYLAPRIKAKLLMFTGLMDTICPPSTQFAAYNRLTCPKQMVLYPDFGHEYLPGAADIAMQFLSEML